HPLDLVRLADHEPTPTRLGGVETATAVRALSPGMARPAATGRAASQFAVPGAGFEPARLAAAAFKAAVSTRSTTRAVVATVTRLRPLRSWRWVPPLPSDRLIPIPPTGAIRGTIRRSTRAGLGRTSGTPWSRCYSYSPRRRSGMACFQIPRYGSWRITQRIKY